MKITLKWRLSKLPTIDEVLKLTEGDKPILTKEEAKEILFSNETEEKKDIKSLENEVKFLKEVIEKLSDRNKIVEVIRTVEHHYPQTGWIQPYVTWCNTGYTSTSGSNAIGSLTSGAGAGVAGLANTINCAFTQIA